MASFKELGAAFEEAARSGRVRLGASPEEWARERHEMRQQRMGMTNRDLLCELQARGEILQSSANLNDVADGLTLAGLAAAALNRVSHQALGERRRDE
jgi:hypothetical protein